MASELSIGADHLKVGPNPSLVKAIKPGDLGYDLDPEAIKLREVGVELDIEAIEPEVVAFNLGVEANILWIGPPGFSRRGQQEGALTRGFLSRPPRHSLCGRAPAAPRS